MRVINLIAIGLPAILVAAMPVLAADATIDLPSPCTCTERIRRVVDGASFEMTLPEPGYPGGGGVCTYKAYLFDEQYCPREAWCIPDVRIKGIKTLGVTSVDRRDECTAFLFPPSRLPFLNTFNIGPYQRGQRVEVDVAWFTGNLLQAYTMSGPLTASVSRFGIHFSGVIPADADPVIAAEVGVSNRWGRRSTAYTIEVQN